MYGGIAAPAVPTPSQPAAHVHRNGHYHYQEPGAGNNCQLIRQMEWKRITSLNERLQRWQIEEWSHRSQLGFDEKCSVRGGVEGVSQCVIQLGSLQRNGSLIVVMHICR